MVGRRADAVIIGGGVMGASIAYHLCKEGRVKPVLLEKGDFFGCGSTSKNAGGIRHQFSSPTNVQLSKLSIGMLRQFEEEMKQPLDLNFCGYLFLLDNQEDVVRFRKQIQMQNQLGVPSVFLEPVEAASMVPEIDMSGIRGGAFCGEDGIADPSGVVNGFCREAARLGAELLLETPAVDIELAAGRVQGVVTPEETIATEVVVIAAGPWSEQVGRLAGLRLPVAPVRRQLAITRLASPVRRDFPFVIDFSKALYFHYEGGGILTGMSNRDERPGFIEEIDEDWRLHHLREAIRRMPLLEEADLVAEWAGLYEVTPDHQPILGRLPEIEGLFTCTGFSGHGFMHGPACGLLMAEEILDGRAHSVNIDPLRWDRFRGETVAEYQVV